MEKTAGGSFPRFVKHFGTRLCVLLLVFSCFATSLPSTSAYAVESTITFVDADNDNINQGNQSLVKSSGGKSFTFSVGSPSDSPYLTVSDTETEKGIYALSGTGNTGSGVHLVMTIEDGYIFDLKSFDYTSGYPNTQLYVSAVPTQKNQYDISSNEQQTGTINSFQFPLTGVSKIDFVSDNYVLFQNIVVDNIRPVSAAPIINTQPQNTAVNAGDNASFSVVASGAAPFTYQWQENSGSGFTAISGATAAALTRNNVTSFMNGYQYRVVVTDTNGLSKTSNAATLTVNSAPTMTTQPQNTAVNAGANASFSVVASGAAPFTYQWQENSGSGFSNISGANAAALTRNNVTSSLNGYQYRVVVTDTNGLSKTSNAATLTVNSAPTMTTQPQNTAVNAGDNASFSVVASGAAPFTYQWQENSGSGFSNISGANAAALTRNNVTTSMNGYKYRVVVTDNNGLSTTSDAATLTVNAFTNAAAPNITMQPDDKNVIINTNTELSISATATGLLSYQWYSNSADSNSGGTLIPDATNSTFSPPTMSIGTTYYYVVVTNTDNAMTGSKTADTTSQAAQVTVNAQPTYTIAPIDNVTFNNLVAGYAAGSQQTRTITITRTGTGELANLTSVLKGANASSFTITQPAVSTLNNAVATTSFTVRAKDGLAPGTYTATVTVSADNMTNRSFTVTQTVNTVTPPVTPDPSVTPPTPTTPQPVSPTPTPPVTPGAADVDVLVNGKVESAGTATTSQQNGQSVTIISIDEAKLSQRLATESAGAVVTIPISSNSNVVVGELNGQMIKNLENKQAFIEIQTNQATYTLPAQQINIDAISAQVGSRIALQDIKVEIQIAEPQGNTLNLIRQAASNGNFILVAPSLDFSVYATYGGQTVEVDKFDAYVQRLIAIPDGSDPSRITTGVVIEPGGTVRHVPTQVVQNNGKYFAKISSLTNSTYSVIWHPLEFGDVSAHWAEEAVNDIGSRMIVNGFADGTFKPNRDMTRAEFAETIVRALGLKPETGTAPFTDVRSSEWYNAAIMTASAYGLMSGLEDGTFRPDDKITREQAMTVVSRAMAISGLEVSLPNTGTLDKLNRFADAKDVSSWAARNVENNLQAGIITGKNGNILDPKAYITRAEIAIMVRNLLSKSDLI